MADVIDALTNHISFLRGTPRYTANRVARILKGGVAKMMRTSLADKMIPFDASLLVPANGRDTCL
jgi:hypothetical protein